MRVENGTKGDVFVEGVEGPVDAGDTFPSNTEFTVGTGRESVLVASSDDVTKCVAENSNDGVVPPMTFRPDADTAIRWAVAVAAPADGKVSCNLTTPPTTRLFEHCGGGVSESCDKISSANGVVSCSWPIAACSAVGTSARLRIERDGVVQDVTGGQTVTLFSNGQISNPGEVLVLSAAERQLLEDRGEAPTEPQRPDRTALDALQLLDPTPDGTVFVAILRPDVTMPGSGRSATSEDLLCALVDNELLRQFGISLDNADAVDELTLRVSLRTPASDGQMTPAFEAIEFPDPDLIAPGGECPP